jgi:hypothetical protein
MNEHARFKFGARIVLKRGNLLSMNLKHTNNFVSVRTRERALRMRRSAV